MTSRREIAQRIVNEIAESPCIKRAWLRGSLAEGSEDEYSDIDIGVEGCGGGSREVAGEIIGYMNRSFDVLFYDWAGSLLPADCVITFFVANLPLHWHIDFGMAVPENRRTLQPTDIEYVFPEHYLKLWVIYSKHLMRKSAGHREEIAKFASRVFDSEIDAAVAPEDMMGDVLRLLKKQAEGRYEHFFLDCEQFFHGRLKPTAAGKA